MPVSVRDNVLQIKVNYSPSVIEKIKTITGRRYNPSDHSWSVPVEFLAQLREALPDLHYDASCEEALERISRVVNASSAMESSLVAVELPGGTLRPYQAAGVRYIEGHGGRAMLADEMGLGKTIQTLGYIARHPDFTVVVVCPSAVKVQ
jgi:SWI/SNF-related matrix-associated actin-dependent regulator 1 of chromatin subfamily A